MSHLDGVPLSVSAIPQTLSDVPSSIPTSSYGVSTSGVQPSFLVPLRMDLLTTILTILLVTSGTVMSFDDHKRFIYLAPPRFSGLIGQDTYEFLLDC